MRRLCKRLRILRRGLGDRLTFRRFLISSQARAVVWASFRGLSLVMRLHALAWVRVMLGASFQALHLTQQMHSLGVTNMWSSCGGSHGVLPVCDISHGMRVMVGHRRMYHPRIWLLKRAWKSVDFRSGYCWLPCLVGHTFGCSLPNKIGSWHGGGTLVEMLIPHTLRSGSVKVFWWERRWGLSWFTLESVRGMVRNWKLWRGGYRGRVKGWGARNGSDRGGVWSGGVGIWSRRIGIGNNEGAWGWCNRMSSSYGDNLERKKGQAWEIWSNSCNVELVKISYTKGL